MINLDKYSFPTPNGKLLSTQDFPNGNMVGYTSQLLFLTQFTDALSLEQVQEFFNGLIDCGAFSGVVSRKPGELSNTSVDDYLSLACNPVFAIKMLKYGRAHWGFFDLNYPKVSFAQFLYRFQGMWQHAKISAGEPLTNLGKLIWAVSLMISAHKPFSWQDAWIQSHLMVLIKERRNVNNPIMDYAVNYWRRRKGSKTTSEIYADYMGFADHPLVEAFKPFN
jgi:hypothetical protein